MHPLKRAPIAYLKADEASSKFLSKYPKFVDVFSPNLGANFPKHTEINNYATEFLNNQQPSYVLIYSLGLVELEILEAYIENNLVNNFIKPSKSPAEVPILFNKKSNNSLKLYVDYTGLNNLTIIN